MRVTSSASSAATDNGGVPWHCSLLNQFQQRVVFVCFTLTNVYVIPYLLVSYSSSQQQNQLRNFHM